MAMVSQCYYIYCRAHLKKLLKSTHVVLMYRRDTIASSTVIALTQRQLCVMEKRVITNYYFVDKINNYKII